jgi:polyhydroxyalkanoate synthase
MEARTIPINSALDAWHRVQFSWTDVLRRAQGDAFEALGLGPDECPYRVVASGSHWRLRDYGDHGVRHCLLIVAAPIKRPYIWDLAASASAVRYCLQQRVHVRLLEWMPASHRNAAHGLEEYVGAIRECVGELWGEASGTKSFLVGHSLGGTLAAIAAAAAPDGLCGLVLLAAPLCFVPQTSRFRDLLVSLLPSTLSETEPVPGSLISYVSALAAPSTFIWLRLRDAAVSVTDHRALDIHA